ncbi:MAG: HEAT repeat domain-containing protein [Planctomycetes bacterium]|nr:HEAT repeat domain-containing protein [Planctomycetota bacterium]
MRSVLLRVASVLVLSGFALGDIDVAISAGSPLEWSNELPFRSPILDRGLIYTPTGSGRALPEPALRPPRRRGGTSVAQELPPRIPSDHRVFGSLNPVGAARILTLDIPKHLPWVDRRLSSRYPERLTYPPETRADLYWLTLAACLRLCFHPAKVSEAETAQFLILVGPPVHETLSAMALGDGGLRGLSSYLGKHIAKVPPRPPDPQPLLAAAADPEQRMLIRWAAMDLVSDHPFAFNPLYARRTLGLGPEGIPVLIACARSDHPLLLQNAAGILAAYEAYDDRVMKSLREISAGADAVARNRAFEGLIRWADPEAEDVLIRTLKSSDRYLRIFAIHALGRMRSIRARTLLQAFLKTVHKDHGETWMTAVSALARIGDPDEATRRLLSGWLKNWREAVEADLAPPVPVYPADCVDPPATRANLLRETIVIALAYLGDSDARDQLIRQFATAGAGQSYTGPGTYPRDPVLGAIEPFNQLLAIEALAAMGEDGRRYLRSIVSRSVDVVLQGYALAHLLRDGRAAGFAIVVAEDPLMPSVLRVQAMEGLAKAEATREDAIGIARAMVDEYVKRDLDAPAKGKAGGATDAGRRIPSYECLSALRLLGRHAPPEVSLVLDVLAKAKERGHYGRVESGEGSQTLPGFSGHTMHVMDARSFPPLLEETLLELGRLADPKAVPRLEMFLKDTFGLGRPEAALALGFFKTKKACAILLDALRDDDPWVRYNAYHSLTRVCGKRIFADWLFGAEAERAAALKAWAACVAEKAKELPD